MNNCKKDLLKSGRRVSGFFHILTELLFPLRCPVCDRPVRFPGKGICPECAVHLKPIREPYCGKCGKPVRDAAKEFCRDCAEKRHFYDRGIALYPYSACHSTIYRLKYGGRREYAGYLSGEMAGVLGRQILEWKPDALIPVPLHKERQKKRDYNQAQLLAEGIGKKLDIPILSGYIVRTRNTLPQKAVEGGLRRNNLKSSFKIVQNDVKLNTIVIIDDIYTTGSTIDAVAKECRRAGVKKIYFAVLAIGSDQKLQE